MKKVFFTIKFFEKNRQNFENNFFEKKCAFACMFLYFFALLPSRVSIFYYVKSP